jgi:ankyrin repeat protein
MCDASDELIDAIKQGDISRTHRILSRDGLDLNFSTGQISPLTHAAIGGRGEIVKLLLERGADPNYVAASNRRGEFSPHCPK